jgi:hypothetical protein
MDYKNKYLKYKSKYLNLKKQYGGSKLTQEEIEFIKSKVVNFTLKAGTILYRTQSENHDCGVQPSKCPDTGKIGMYFANSLHIPVGMVLEYKKPLNLCKYRTTKDLRVYYGKYSFRWLEPDIFYENMDDWKNHKFKLNTNPKNKELWNHYDKIYPIIGLFLEEDNVKIWERVDIGEIFITDEADIEFVKFEELVTIEHAKAYLESELNYFKEQIKLYEENNQNK